MTKPIIFFSHSGRDAELIKAIKDRINLKTGNSLDIFLSSDGTSIRGGTNWVIEVERNLDNCKLMFVFMTPNSLRSEWIYFESGHAYSKKIKVVPLGLIGIDIGILEPPISLLHGFNVTDNKTLENIIGLINEEFKLSFQNVFSDFEWPTLENGGNVIENISEMLVEFQHQETFFSGHKISIKNSELKWFSDTVASIFKSKSEIEPSHSSSTSYLGKGVVISRSVIGSGKLGDDKASYDVRIDPFAFESIWESIVKFSDDVYGEVREQIPAQILLSSRLHLPANLHSITGRLSNNFHQIIDGNWRAFQYKNGLQFSFNITSEMRFSGNEHRVHFFIYVPRVGTSIAEINRVIDGLLECGVISW